jgi:hypothetical protein
MKLIDIFWKRIRILDVFIRQTVLIFCLVCTRVARIRICMDPHFFGVAGVKMLNLQERDTDPHPIPDPH